MLGIWLCVWVENSSVSTSLYVMYCSTSGVWDLCFAYVGSLTRTWEVGAEAA